MRARSTLTRLTALSALALGAVMAVTPVAAQPTPPAPAPAPAPAKPAASAPAPPKPAAPKPKPAAPSAPPAGSASPGASAAPAGSASPGASALPPGHPPMDPGGMPPGHPPMDPAGMPPGHPSAPSQERGFFRPRQDAVLVSDQLPPGTIDALIVDADERPLAGVPMSLSILRNSVTKGESRESREAVTNQQGRVIFRDMPVGSGVSFTVNSSRGEAGFASQPFALKHDHGVKVLLHTYEPVSDLGASMMVMEAILVLEIKEDSISVNHLVRGLNLGRTAFVSKNVSMALPKGWKAFNNQESAGGVAMVERDGRAHLQGTFPPGQAEVTYRYQVPLSGDATQKLTLPLPPRVAQTTVMVSAGKGMTLNVAGFPAAEPGRRRDGQRVLQTAKQVDPAGGIQQFLSNTDPGLIEITVSGIPTPGPARWLAGLLGLIAIAGGVIYFAQSQKLDKRRLATDERQDLEEARDALLGEVALLERARHSGEVGPRSYERLRAALLDALARILVRLDADAALPPLTAGAGLGAWTAGANVADPAAPAASASKASPSKRARRSGSKADRPKRSPRSQGAKADPGAGKRRKRSRPTT